MGWFGAASSARKIRRCSPGEGALSTTSRCRACCTPRSCAARTRTRHPRHRQAAALALPGVHAVLTYADLPESVQRQTLPLLVPNPAIKQPVHAVLPGEGRSLLRRRAGGVRGRGQPLHRRGRGAAGRSRLRAAAGGVRLPRPRSNPARRSRTRDAESNLAARIPGQGRRHRPRLRRRDARLPREDLPAPRRAVLHRMPRRDRGATTRSPTR